MLEVLDVGDTGTVVQHRAAHGDGGAHTLADDPLLVLVLAGHGVASSLTPVEKPGLPSVRRQPSTRARSKSSVPISRR